MKFVDLAIHAIIEFCPCGELKFTRNIADIFGNRLLVQEEIA